MVSHDLLCSTVTDQTAFDQRDSKWVFRFECATNRCCQALVSRLETLRVKQLHLTVNNAVEKLGAI